MISNVFWRRHVTSNITSNILANDYKCVPILRRWFNSRFPLSSHAIYLKLHTRIIFKNRYTCVFIYHYRKIVFNLIQTRNLKVFQNKKCLLTSYIITSSFVFQFHWYIYMFSYHYMYVCVCEFIFLYMERYSIENS